MDRPLGGPDDIAELDRHIRCHSLQVIQRVEFYESEYMWMVYVLMKKQDFDDYGGQFWWNMLDAKNTRKVGSKQA
uniref:Uncharacterized protein n=1 Tax=Candidatus Kentrum eta TaxID=2126337 RepID=A0A450VW24_9GAMM|nr:MAG: hypothetical protein BECKH772B_GA0070898_105561 [Candidatus Kentron sp. H]VFK05639.1 MAG: hypothetical protein BECKH772A_GA0070896_105751 [Candidatus Kentron sp. H]VFK09018.1 MAG: hypothetical protein BECKH772C_GA0070978_105701 [Candidatus Kentron sp. H]